MHSLETQVQRRIGSSNGRQINFPVPPSMRPTIAIKQVFDFPEKKIWFLDLYFFEKFNPKRTNDHIQLRAVGGESMCWQTLSISSHLQTTCVWMAQKRYG